MLIKDNDKLPWEDLFEQATEDTSKYLWAISEWPDPRDGYDQDYLLIAALSSRMRSGLALGQMTSDMPPEYDIYKKKLGRMRLEAENVLNRQVLSNQNQIEAVLNGKALSRLNLIKEILSDISAMSENRIGYDNSEWLEESARETAHDFLLLFDDAALANDELNQAPLNTLHVKDFQKELRETEKLFWRHFDCFYVVKDLFLPLRSSDYFLNRWWFTRVPQASGVSEAMITAEAV